MTDVVDAEVVEENALAVQSAPVSLFGTTEPDEVVDKAARHATALARVINERNLYSNIQGRDHVQVEGWQLLGSMTGVFAVVTETKPIVDSNGAAGWEARCEARTMSGQVIGAADAMCTRSERTWSSRDDYAIRSMAQTRATSKALKGPLGFIVKLAGYSSTPLEEIPHDDAPYEGPECPTCSSPVWDNSQDPNRGKRPKWKCKDKNCGWASWDDDPFEESQAGASQPSSVPPEQGASDVATAAAEAPQAEPVSDPGSASPPWYEEWVDKVGAAEFCKAATKFAKSGAVVTDPAVTEKATKKQRDSIIGELTASDWSAPEKASA